MGFSLYCCNPVQKDLLTIQLSVQTLQSCLSWCPYCQFDDLFCYERFWETVLYIGRIDTDRNNEQSNVVIKFRFSTKIWQTFQRKVSGWPLLFNPCLLISLNKGGFAKTLQNRRAGHGPISCQVKQFFEMFLLLLLLHYDLWFSQKSRNA